MGWLDLVDPRWKGKIAIAKPLFGTTATHATCLFVALGRREGAGVLLGALKQNQVQVLSGNKQVATAVGSGQVLFGLTDTDDAIGEIEAGRPVAIIYPDRRPRRAGDPVHPQRPGHPQGGARTRLEAEALGNTLLGPEVRGEAGQRGPSAQIPLNRKTDRARRGSRRPRTVHAMPADFEAAVRIWDHVAAYLASEFTGG